MISHVSIIPSCRKPGSPPFSGAFFFWGMIPIVPDRSNRAGNQLLIIQAPMGTGKNYIQIYTQFVVSSIFNIHNVTYTILCTQYCIYTHTLYSPDGKRKTNRQFPGLRSRPGDQVNGIEDRQHQQEPGRGLHDDPCSIYGEPGFFHFRRSGFV